MIIHFCVTSARCGTAPERQDCGTNTSTPKIGMCIIGVSLSEPYIDESNGRNLYIYSSYVTRNICLGWLYGHKRKVFLCAFSCPGYGPF